MTNKKKLATITIVVEDRQTHAPDVNRILSEAGHIIIARLGVNVSRTCVSNCTGMITVAVEGTTKEIKDLTKRLDDLYGIVAKCSIMTK